MPATSKAMRKAAAIAEHHPEKLMARNRGMLKMTGEQLHHFAATREKGLPKHAKAPAHRRAGPTGPMNRYGRMMHGRR